MLIQLTATTFSLITDNANCDTAKCEQAVRSHLGRVKESLAEVSKAKGSYGLRSASIAYSASSRVKVDLKNASPEHKVAAMINTLQSSVANMPIEQVEVALLRDLEKALEDKFVLVKEDKKEEQPK